MDQAQFEETRAILGTLPPAAGDLLPPGASPATGSKAAADFAEFAGTDFIRIAYSQAALSLTAAADHMSALERALTEPVMTFAPWTLARAVMEASATALWLLDPEIDAGVRTARGMTLRYRGLRDQVVFISDALDEHPEGATTLDAAQAAERVQRVEAQARAMLFEVLRDRRGRVIGFGEPLPPMTDLVATQLGERGFYRLFSGVAHGRAWATLPTGLRQVGSEAVTQDLDIVGALWLITGTVDWFSRVAWRYVEIMGWDLDRLARVLEAEYDSGHRNTESRFWRDSTSNAS